MEKKGKHEAKSLPEAHGQQALSGCLHYTYEGTVHLKKAIYDILVSSHGGPCKLCPRDSLVKKEDMGNLKHTGKQKKKKKKGTGAAKVQTSALQIDMWVCLTCNGYFCIQANIKGGSHLRAHAKQTEHWWAAKSDDPSTAYCFRCDREVLVQELLNEVLAQIAGKKVGTAAPKSNFVIRGLPSLGNESCFNAVLQNILSLKSLRQEMLGLEFPRTATISIALSKLFVSTSRSNEAVLDQEHLLSQICSKYPNFRSKHMLDSEESLCCFLDALHTDQKDAWAGVPIVVNSTVVDSVFAGKRSITVSCSKCSCCFAKDEEFFYLSLPIPSRSPLLANDCTQSSYFVSLQDCLKLYTCTEQLICENCTKADGPKDDKVPGAADRRICISTPPQVLALHLKRCNESHNQAKRLKELQYEQNLDIAPFMDPRYGADGDVSYFLTGAVLHKETMHGGHYMANVKADSLVRKGTALSWYNAVDEQVRKTWKDAFAGEPHLLFYRKVMTERKDMHCKEPAPDQVGSNTEQVKTPLPPVRETVEGSHHMGTNVNIIKGLPNNKNSCFFNAMLQSLLALDPLRCKMLGPDVWTGPLALSLKQLFVETSASNVSPDLLDTKNLFRSTCAMFPIFKKGDMEDCHELLRLFLDGLDVEEAEARQLQNNAPIGVIRTTVNSVFAGSLSKTVSSIQCRHSSTKVDTFHDVSLPIPEGSHASIDDCWALHTEQEPFDGEWPCPECTSAQGNGHPVKRNAMQRILMDRLPSVLVVTLKRFKFIRSIETSVKLSTKVYFTEKFDVQPFMNQRSLDKTLYQLVAVVQHTGNPAGGHYVAYVKANKMECQKQYSSGSGSKSWFYASDECVRETSLNEVLSCEPYILFYERCLTDISQCSTNLTGEDSQIADIHMMPYSGDTKNAKLTFEESQLADTNMEPQTSASPMCVEFQRADNNMQPQTGASTSNSSPPIDEVQLWEYQRTRNRKKQERNEINKDNDALGQRVGFFLERFKLQDDIRPFYECELVMMCQRGSGSRELNIHYSHLVSHSKRLAMDVCNKYTRLMVRLKETAIHFVQTMLENLDLTETARRRMQQLASADPASSLELKFLNMPKMHGLLREHMLPPLTKPVRVYGNTKIWVRTPLPEKCAILQKLLAYMLSCHRDGLSWNGGFTLDHVDVYDDRVFITKSPNSYSIYPKISPEMISSMEKDFERIALDVLKKFDCHGASIPYLKHFFDMLNNMTKYSDWWSNLAKAEALRELIEHHPFLKPSMARSNLSSGIFNAYRSHDEGDKSVAFKMLLERGFDLSDPWMSRHELLQNPMLRSVFKYKDKKVPADQAAGPGQQAAGPGQPAGPGQQVTGPGQQAAGAGQPAAGAGQPAAGGDQQAAGAGQPAAGAGQPAAGVVKYYEEAYGFLFEYLRHLFHHGSACSFRSRGQNAPREQLMQSLDAARIVEADVVEGLACLLKNLAMTGLLFAVWDCYKNCNYPYRVQRRY